MPPKTTKSKLPSIDTQLADLQEAVSFLESTSDIDAAITRYEGALKSAAQLSAMMADKKQQIVTLKTTYDATE
jgi:exonuclease VII small subunit